MNDPRAGALGTAPGPLGSAPGGVAAAPAVAIPLPPEPASIEQTGLSLAFLADLAIKTLYARGQLTLSDIAASLGLPITNVTDKVMEWLKNEHFVEIKGGSGMSAASYVFTVVDKGAEKARQALDRSQYVGRAPVPLAPYVAAVKRQSIQSIAVTQEQVARAFSQMVLPRETVAELGPAVNSGKSIFLFGPPGNGKTMIADIMVSLLTGEVVLPYAVEVDGQVIQVFDQVYHRPVMDQAASDRLRFDHRWAITKRPVVVTGGELTLEMLDLIYEDTGKLYEAPFQMKANGGIFMIDDFGRQRVSPRDLLNRWIVPLEKRVDYLALKTGKKIEIPFDMLIIFSTNLDPKDLVDDAFLRRIRYKIGIFAPTLPQFEEIFKRMCAHKRIAFTPEGFALFLAYYKEHGLELRSCHPRDLLEQLSDAARFFARPAALEPDLVRMACDSYFVKL